MKFKGLSCCSILIFLGVFMFFVNTSVAEEVLVVANKSVPTDALNPDDVKNIFLGNVTKWNNNDTITLVVSKNSDVHESFLKKFIKRNSSQFTNVWKQNLFTGKGRIPKKFDSTEELVEYISSTKGAIGYVSVNTQINGNIKVVTK